MLTNLEKEVGINEFTILTYSANTDEWKEANANLEEKKKELSEQIELRLRFEELRAKLNAWEEGKFRKEIDRREVERIDSTIIEEGET